MNTVRVIPQPAAIAKLIMTGGAVAKVACHAPAVVKFVSVGTQGIAGLGAVAGAGLVRVGQEMRLAIETLPNAY